MEIDNLVKIKIKNLKKALVQLKQANLNMKINLKNNQKRKKINQVMMAKVLQIKLQIKVLILERIFE
jgi:hypothetical protein